jgi:uncharacterized protein (UPF0333 family)
MKKVLLIYAVLLVAIAVTYFGFISETNDNNDNTKKKAIAVSKHSKEFNLSMEKVMDAYYNLTEAFVKQDSGAVNKNGMELKTALDNLKMSELKKDTIIYETAVGSWSSVKNEIQGMISDPTMDAKRESLSLFSNQLYDLLRIIHYDIAKIYLQECPTAFGGDTPGNWLSKTVAVRNPYFGTNDPAQKDKMLNCGGPKDTLNFIAADSIKK